jgi:hypothetical protein
MLLRFVPTVLLIVTVFVGIDILYRYRAAAMRSLAVKYGFDFIPGPSWYDLRKQLPVPKSFRLRGYPLNTLRRTWNVVEGERNGLHVLIVDSILGMGGARGRYSTFIAVQVDQDPFGGRDSEEKTAHSNGWFAIYRLRFWQVPWTLSVERIETHLDHLSRFAGGRE